MWSFPCTLSRDNTCIQCISVHTSGPWIPSVLCSTNPFFYSREQSCLNLWIVVVQWKCSLQKICLLAQKHFIFISLLKYFPKTISMFTVRVAQTTNTREEIFWRSVADISRISIFLFLLLILRVLLIYPDNSSLFSKYIFVHTCASFDVHGSWSTIHIKVVWIHLGLIAFLCLMWAHVHQLKPIL